ncbi:hypothetical protein F9L07_21190 [Pimelobacter simplex]|uniref:PknH-like extracellular domain-containing protein n=1 Tax=Nocardioides simplex TaxID=2045 RepID=A0A7J5DWG6_NOCSI|nr:hypothetical protein [Pimelobacter simplex]KAB2809530.1 hypothetical protein F9L07_21190 [Pimelobacter simplex]
MPEQQHDPIEELSRFGAGLSTGPGGGEMPLSAADVRRRGDRIRRRRTALVTGAAALAVAAVTVPVLALSLDGSQRDDSRVANDRVKALSEADLLTDDDTVYSDGADWFTIDTFEGDGQAAFHLCARSKLAGLGAEDVFQRTYELRNLADDAPSVSGDEFREVVAQFATTAEADKALQTIASWIDDCGERAVAEGTPDHRVLQTTPIEVGLDDSDAQVIDAHYGPVPREIDPTGDAAYIAETGLVRVGNRIAILDSRIVGQDYTFLDGTPVTRMIPRAAELLLPGTTPQATVTTPGVPEPSEAAGATELPDDLPLADGWPEIDGDGSLEGPARDQEPFSFAPCGTDVPDAPEPADRITARWQEPEDFRGRQLSSYTSAAEARRAADAIVNAYRACPDGPRDDAGYVSHHAVADGDLGDESWVLGRSSTFDGAPAPGLDVTYVVRVGNTLLLITGAGEGGGSDPAGDILTTASAMADESTALLTSLCRFAGSTCAG